MKHGSLFSGIGGFDLAAEWLGWENVFHCEINDFGRKVLNYHFPNSISYEDITKTDFTIHRGHIDILSGGFPCQPFSMAGKRKGKEDERHLWPQMLRAIREIRPKYIVGENVYGLINWDGGLVFDEVQSDLEAEGYEVIPVVLPAVSVNAPHRRDRIWFVARHTESIGGDKERKIQRGENSDSDRVCTENAETTPDTNSGGLERSEKERWDSINVEREGEFRDAADTTSNRRERERKRLKTEEGHETRPESARELEGRSEGLRTQRDAADTDCPNCKTQPQGGLLEEKSAEGQARGFVDGYSSPQWLNFPTQSPVRSGDDGLPTELDGITFSKWRNESIKAYGNAIVPQVAYEIFKVIDRLHNYDN